MKPFSPAASFSRRDVIKGLAAASALAAVRGPLFAQTSAGSGDPSREAVLKYLTKLARADGGFAFEDQEMSHLTPTFAVIGSLRLLHALPANGQALAHYVRTHHPRELKKLEQERRSFEFQQVQALIWLGDKASDFHERIEGFKAPLPYLKQYEKHGYPVFQSELGVVQCHALLGLSLDPIKPAFLNYISVRRRANGSFNNTPTTDGGDGHVMNTCCGLQALRVFEQPEEKKAETIAWVQSCQRPSGGFTYQPQPMFGGVDDVGYTRAAARALQLLGATPSQRDACVAWILSLANADGGFGDRPGWLSNPLATYYALDTLDALGALDALKQIRRPAPRAKQKIPADLKIYSIQIEAHGVGSPAEAVALAGALKIDLWGSKNPKPGWLERVREIAAAQKVPVQFFTADEEYGTWVDIPGLGTYSHTSDVMGPPVGDIGESLAEKGPVTWPQYRERRLASLMKGDGRLVWQFGENEELVRMFLDDSVERGGFAGISTFHFGNPDFTNTEPFLNRWRGQIPFISLQDAHGVEPWWFSDMTTGHRTLFLATEPTWQGWLKALKQNWVVAVRHDEVSRQQTWTHSGSPEVLEFVRQRESQWRWWNNSAVQRPLVSLVALTSKDEFEVAHPAKGVALRVRCAWKNTAQGMPASPLAEFVRLELDGVEVHPAVIEKKRANGPGLADHYHLLELPELPSGKHVAVVTVKEIERGAEARQTVEFIV